MFLRNIFKVCSANALSQVISLLAVPVITRIYDPNEYGIFNSVYLAYVMLLFPIAGFRLNAAVLLPKSDEDASELFLISCISTLIFSTVVGLIILSLIAGDLLPNSWNSSVYTTMLLLIPIGIFIQGIQQNLISWTIRQKRFNTSAISRISESVCDRSSVLTYGFLLSNGFLGLIIGRILGPMIASIILFKNNYKELAGIMNRINGKKCKALLKRYNRFIFFSTPAAIFDTASRQVPLIIMSWYFVAEAIGHYALAIQVVNLPMLVISDAITNVFMQKAAQSKQQGVDITADIKILIKYMLYLILPIISVLIFSGPMLFSFVFGERWVAAGELSSILAIMFLFTFIHRPLSAFFDVHERQRARFFFDLVLLIGRCSCIFAGALIFDSMHVAITLLVVWSSIVYLTGLVYLLRVVGISFFDFSGTIKNAFLSATPLILFLAIVSKSSVNINLLLMLLSSGIAIHIIWIILFDPNLRLKVSAYMVRR